MTHDFSVPCKLGVAEHARRARAASRALARVSHQDRNLVLMAVAEAIEAHGHKILEANKRDCQAGVAAVASGGISPAMLKRLELNPRDIEEMAGRVRDVARLPDPLGRRLAATELDEGLVLYKDTCPLGVIGVIFESRPEVAPQVAALALKSGNAVILKGGAEARHSNEAIADVWRNCITHFPIVPLDSICFLQSRAEIMELLALDDDVDLIIPRGSRELVEFVARNSRIPVLGHGEGICHVYVDGAANVDKAIEITMDSKVQYPAACNAAETLLVHQDIASRFLPLVVSKLTEAGVEVRGCPQTILLSGIPEMVPASETDWATEYSDLVLSVKVVAGVEDAISHIHRYGSSHTETIVTEDTKVAQTFLDEVDAAGVYHNASTRFADGFRYGFGAELGISTNKLHARGPVGLDGLTTYKYRLIGNGHTVAEYSSGARHFKHRPIG
jgi:glutamate-5-semialdehyde dehydrogenase